jgi:hypothetical protein
MIQLPLAPIPATLATTEWSPLTASQNHASRNGITRRKSWDYVVNLVERECTRDVHYAKGRGGSWNATANSTGHRCNEDTTEVSCLILDSDDDGDPAKLFAALTQQGAAYLAYGSPSWSDTCPKYRMAVPLSAPIDVTTKEGEVKYKAVLLAWRRVCTELAGYTPKSGIAFDSAPSATSNHFYFGHRRPGTDDFRPFWQGQGQAIDADALLALDAANHPPVKSTSASIAGTGNSSYTKDPNSKFIAVSEDFEVKLADGTVCRMVELPRHNVHAICPCPAHAASTKGTGSTHTYNLKGRMCVRCCVCNLTWFLPPVSNTTGKKPPRAPSSDPYADNSGTPAAPTQEDEDAALAEHEAAMATLAEYRLTPEIAPVIAKAESATYSYSPQLHVVAKRLASKAAGLAAGWRSAFMASGLATDTKVRTCPNMTSYAALSLVTGKASILWRPCGRKNCYACGPELLAQEELALLHFPVTAPLKGDTETDGMRVPTGLPLSSREAYLQLVPQGFLKQARDAARKSKVCMASNGDAYLPVSMPSGDWLVWSTAPLWSSARRAKWQEALDADTTPEVAAMRARFSMPVAMPAAEALEIFMPLWRSAATPSPDIDGVDGKPIHLRQTRMEKSAGLTGQLANVLSDSRKGTVAVFPRAKGTQGDETATKAKAVWKSHNVKVRESQTSKEGGLPRSTADRTSANILIQAFDLKVCDPSKLPAYDWLPALDAAIDNEP